MTYFDPVVMNLNPVVPGIFNFTTINVASGSTLKFTENKYHGPVYFLASGNVTISGILDLTGDDYSGYIRFVSERVPNAAGSGGFSGGIAAFNGANPAALPGNGPGGGAAGKGGTNTSNQFLVPLIGGSGGSGGGNVTGGAGGGAVLIASSTTITINSPGAINTNGGSGCGYGAGCGAGGTVRLVANIIQGSGTVSVAGGSGDSPGGRGAVRFESNNLGGVGVSGVEFTIRSTPFALNLPATPAPSIKVTNINGQAINSNPFTFPDLTINATSQVPFTIQAQYVPVGTVAKIYVFSETGPDQVINIGPLTATGTDQTVTTATVNITYPAGGSRGYVKATW